MSTIGKNILLILTAAVLSVNIYAGEKLEDIDKYRIAEYIKNSYLKPISSIKTAREARSYDVSYTKSFFWGTGKCAGIRHDEKKIFINPKCITKDDRIIAKHRVRGFETKFQKGLIDVIAEKVVNRTRDNADWDKKLKNAKFMINALSFFKGYLGSDINIKKRVKKIHLDFLKVSLVDFLDKDYHNKENRIDDPEIREQYFAFINDFYNSNKVLRTKERLAAKYPYHKSKGRAKYLGPEQKTESLWRRFKLIENAKESLDITYFIYQNDPVSLAFLRAVYNKALKDKHVKIRLMLDGLNFMTKYSLNCFFYILKQVPNIEVRIFNTHRMPGVDLIASNHDKILLADGKRLITGGRNIGKEYFLDNETIKILDEAGIKSKPYVFADADIYVEFEKINYATEMAFNREYYSTDATDFFLRDEHEVECKELSPDNKDMRIFRHSLDEILHKISYKHMDSWHRKNFIYETKEVPLYQSMEKEEVHKYEEGFFNVTITPLDKTSRTTSEKMDMIGDHVNNLIKNSKEEIYFKNPYVLPTDKFVETLTKHSNDNDIRLNFVTNTVVSTEKQVLCVQFFNRRSFLDDIKEENRRLQLSLKPVIIHEKMMVFDNKVSVHGSYNLDYLSMINNSELVLVVEGEEFNRDLKVQLDNWDNEYTKSYGYVMELLAKELSGGRKVYLNWLKVIQHFIKRVL